MSSFWIKSHPIILDNTLYPMSKHVPQQHLVWKCVSYCGRQLNQICRCLENKTVKCSCISHTKPRLQKGPHPSPLDKHRSGRAEESPPLTLTLQIQFIRYSFTHAEAVPCRQCSGCSTLAKVRWFTVSNALSMSMGAKYCHLLPL